MAIDPQTLLAEANCYRCYQGTEWLLELALLSLIAENMAAATGIPQVFSGHGVPVGLQAGQNAGLAALYTDLDTGIIYPWNIDTGAWETTL